MDVMKTGKFIKPEKYETVTAISRKSDQIQERDVIFAVCQHYPIKTFDGVAMCFEGTEERQHWANPKYSSFIVHYGKYVHQKSNSNTDPVVIGDAYLYNGEPYAFGLKISDDALEGYGDDESMALREYIEGNAIGLSVVEKIVKVKSADSRYDLKMKLCRKMILYRMPDYLLNHIVYKNENNLDG